MTTSHGICASLHRTWKNCVDSTAGPTTSEACFETLRELLLRMSQTASPSMAQSRPHVRPLQLRLPRTWNFYYFDRLTLFLLRQCLHAIRAPRMYATPDDCFSPSNSDISAPYANGFPPPVGRVYNSRMPFTCFLCLDSTRR